MHEKSMQDPKKVEQEKVFPGEFSPIQQYRIGQSSKLGHYRG